MTKQSDSDNDEESPERTPQLQTKSKGGKRVSFPPDEEMVSGFAEHRDTERTVDSLTLAEVLLAYERSCEKHLVEPRPRIREQLEQQAACVNGGIRCLDLEGERLDHSSCEALEVVLKSLSFDLINLRAAKLEQNGASSLLDMILYYESTAHLDISDTGGWGISGWKALSYLINQSACLRRLDLSGTPLEGYPARALARALLTSRLAELRLHDTGLSGRPLFTLVGALRANRGLQDLDLSGNRLNSFQDAMQLGDLVRHNGTLRSLDLSHNALADTGLEDICEGLREQSAGLKVLILRNNQITCNGLEHLAKALPTLKTLRTLDLGENRLENRGVRVLKEPLMVNRSLQRLGLAQTHITCEGAVALAEFIAESRQIRSLDVRGNEVRAGGLMALSLALRINRSLTTLDLDRTPKEEQEDFLVVTQKALLEEISALCVSNASAAAGTVDQASA